MVDVTTPVASGTKIGELLNNFLNGFFRLTDNSGNEIGSKIGTRTHGPGATRLAYAGTSAASSAITASEVLLHNCGTGRCYFRAGSGTPTATVNDTPLEPGEKWAIRITSGDKVAAIQDTAGGNLNIIPLS